MQLSSADRPVFRAGSLEQSYFQGSWLTTCFNLPVESVGNALATQENFGPVLSVLR